MSNEMEMVVFSDGFKLFSTIFPIGFIIYYRL